MKSSGAVARRLTEQDALELKPDFVKMKSNDAHCVKQLNPIIREGLQRIGQASQALSGWPGLDRLADDPLLLARLETSPVCDVELERLLTSIRQSLLTDALNASTAPPPRLRLFTALATQCYLNEYVFAVTDAEDAQVTALKNAVMAAQQHQTPIAPMQLVALAAYLPLDRLPDAATLLERPWPEAVMTVLIQQIREPLEQAKYRCQMPRLTTIDGGVSTLVRNQYEENPYPRWVKAGMVPPAPTINAYVRQQFPEVAFQPLREDTNSAILIAGCGTGLHSLDIARRYPGSRVLAIDISLNSLAYAQRKTLELGVTNLRYAQADILRLEGVDETFDLIESVGVLHHLQDPVAGWMALLSHLRPGGLMSLGFYSERARRPVVMARERIARQGYQATASDIRRFRQDFMVCDEPEYRYLTQDSDFFTLSGCRDLLFHVHEHHFTLSHIAELMRELELNFLGFILDQRIKADYLQRFPDDPTAISLDNWEQFEQEHPRTFAWMYQFWVQRVVPFS